MPFSCILVVRLYWHVGVFLVQFLHLFLNEGRLGRIHQKMGLVQILDDEVMLLVQEEQELLHRSIAAPHHCWSAVGYLRRRRQRTKSPALLSWRVPLARREKIKKRRLALQHTISQLSEPFVHPRLSEG